MTHRLSSAELCLYYWKDAPEAFRDRIEGVLPPGVLKTEECCKALLLLYMEHFPQQIETLLSGKGLPDTKEAEIIADLCVEHAVENGRYYPVAV